MGGRKGYSLKNIVGDLRKVKSEQKQLLQGIKSKSPHQVVSASASILAKSKTALESLADGFLFVGGLSKSEYKHLSRERTKGRRRELARRWASYRKEVRRKYDTTTNREVVNSTTRVLGARK